MALAALVRSVAGATARRAAVRADPRRARGLAVLRRLPHHARDLGAVGRRGPRGRRSRTWPTRSCRSASSSSPCCSPRSASAPTASGGCSGRSWSSGSSCWPCWACRTSSSTPGCCWGSRRRSRWRSSLDHPFTAFIAMGAVVLAITGAEALYADMGHFGRRPIRVSWFALVFPALILNYLGQAALIINDPSAVSNPFYLLAPGWARWPLVVLATAGHRDRLAGGDLRGVLGVAAGRAAGLPAAPHRAAHVDASRAGRSTCPPSTGCCSRACWCSCWCSESSNKLATAYGVAVTGTLVITTTLFLMYAAIAWRWATWKLVLGARGVRRRRAHLPRAPTWPRSSRAAGCRCWSRRWSSP